MKLFILIILTLKLSAYSICPNGDQECEVGQIRILDTKKLFSFDSTLSEFSALTLKNNHLYFLSDKGRLLHYDIAIKNNKITFVEYQKSFILKDKHGKKLAKEFRDAEGMAVYADHLLISFEGHNRVDEYDIYGNRYRTLKLNKKLRHQKSYISDNKGLESVAYSPLYGVVTAPEAPLKNKKKHRLYSKEFQWKFDLKGEITELDFIDTHTIMILLREEKSTEQGYRSSLAEIDLSSCIDKTCKVELLAQMDSKKGWKIDNFEGVTKIGANSYLMVSDDNNSFFQKTLLVLFEIVKR